MHENNGWMPIDPVTFKITGSSQSCSQTNNFEENSADDCSLIQSTMN